MFHSSAPIAFGVFGEFNAGKSTLLNSLLGKAIQATDVQPTTARIAVIVGRGAEPASARTWGRHWAPSTSRASRLTSSAPMRKFTYARSSTTFREQLTMACGQLTTMVGKHLRSNSVNSSYEPFTDWMPAIGIDTVRAVIRSKQASANFQYRLAMQTAAVRTNDPDAWSELEAGWNTEGDHTTNDISVSSANGSKFFCRFGIAYSNTTGSTLQQSDVSLQGQ